MAIYSPGNEVRLNETVMMSKGTLTDWEYAVLHGEYLPAQTTTISDIKKWLKLLGTCFPQLPLKYDNVVSRRSVKRTACFYSCNFLEIHLSCLFSKVCEEP